MSVPSLRSKVGWVMLLTLIFWGSCHVARAADPSSDTSGEVSAAAVPWLLGDWKGYRTKLRDFGIDLQLGYTGEFAYNLTGGTRREAAYADQYTAGTTLDLDRLLGLQGATLQATVTVRTGRSLSDDAALGTLQEVQEIFGRGQTARLTQLWLDQKFLGGALDWKVGRMTFGEDFAAFACDFENLTFCGSAPGNLVSNYIFNWPVSQWATRARYDIGRLGYIQAGLYDVNPHYLGTDNKLLPVFYSGSTGVLMPAELAWLPNAGGTLPGSYKIGGWYDTSSADDVASDVNGSPFAVTGRPPKRRQGRFGGYINFSQQLTPLPVGQSKGGLSAFFNAVAASDLTSVVDSQLAAGLVYTGPFRSRPDDDIAFAVGMTHVSGRIAAAEAQQNAMWMGPVPVRGAELAMELHYTLRPTSGLLLRPSLQFVINPGGTSHNADALVLGLTTAMRF